MKKKRWEFENEEMGFEDENLKENEINKIVVMKKDIKEFNSYFIIIKSTTPIIIPPFTP